MNNDKLGADATSHQEHESLVLEEPNLPFTYKDTNLIIVAVSLSLGFLAAILGTSIYWNLLQTDILKDLGPVQTSSLTWSFPTLVCLQTLSTLLFGRLSDFVGRRWIFLFGNLIAFIGFLATGRAHNGSTITGLTVLVGVGTGIQALGPFVALAELVPVRQRFTVVGSCLCLFAPVVAMYPAIAEALTEHSNDSWHWVYQVNAILSFVALLGLSVSYHPPTYHELHAGPEAEHLKSKDWTGLMILSLSFSSFAWLLLIGNRTWKWDSAQEITLTTVSGGSFVGFLIYEFFWGHEHRAFPQHLLRNWAIFSQLLIGSVSSVFLAANPFAYLILETTIRSGSMMDKAWEVSLWSAGLTVGWILATVMLSKPRWIKWHLVAGIIVQGAFECGYAAMRAERTALIRAFMILSGIGQGYAMLLAYVTATIVIPKRDIGVVMGFIVGFRNVIYGVVEALFQAIFLPKTSSGTIKFVSEAALANGLPPTSLPALFQALQAVQAGASTSVLLQVPGISPEILQAAEAGVLKAATNAWIFILELAMLLFIPLAILALASPNVDMYLSNDVWVRLRRNVWRARRSSSAINSA